MSMMENAALLRNYVENGSDSAFGQLVSRYFDLVYSAALRLVAGDAHLAQDVAQTVFTDFARKARTLPADVLLGGWLYQHTCFTATKAVRSERRRQARERLAVEMNLQTDPPEVDWHQLAPVLEEAMSHLKTADRDALVLRFFERQSFRAVGDSLGTSEDGARKRVDRALDKLRGFFGRRGMVITAAVLADALNTQAVTIAPAGVAATVTTASLAGVAAGASATIPILKLMLLTKSKIAFAVLAASMATVAIIQSHANARLDADNQALRRQTASLAAASAENQPLATAPKSAPIPSSALSTEEFNELLRLRGEAGRLKSQLTAANLSLARDKAAQLKAPADPVVAAIEAKQAAIEKMIYVKQWLLAFHLFAAENNGLFPTNLEQAVAYAPAGDKGETKLATDQFEVVYQGRLDAIPKLSQTIVIREKEATQSPTDGRWSRSYGFADGHSEIHVAPDGNFEPWESQHLLKPGQ
jgi:RNA polymerase sigma factor (sigma-70 family)